VLLSAQKNNAEHLLPNLSTQVTLPFLNVEQLLEEDKNARPGTPFRYGYKFDVDFSLNNSGEWVELENADRLWKFTIKSEGALGLFFNSNAFYLPVGSELFIYNDDRSMFRKYTNTDSKASMSFSSSSIKGDIMHLEYYEPYSVYNEGSINIISIIHDYKDIFNISRDIRDESCGDDVSEHLDEYRMQINATGLLDTRQGNICTGTLLNNEWENHLGYYWTAWHCVNDYIGSESLTSIYFENFRFYFDFIAGNQYSYEDFENYATGASLLAHSDGMNPDYALMVINDFSRIEADELCFSGWDASHSQNSNSNPPMLGIGVHHPSGHPKKMIFDQGENAVSYPGEVTWKFEEEEIQSQPHYHWQVEWNEGSTAPGSSGSGLFNDQGLLVGQLSGGNADCTTPAMLEEDCTSITLKEDCLDTVGCAWMTSGTCILALEQDFYGKFSHAFFDETINVPNGETVQHYLDRDNTGITSMNGTCICHHIPEGACNCAGDVLDKCGICDGGGPQFPCEDQYGIVQAILCSQEACDEYFDYLDASDPLPTQLFLGQNYPNPFNPTTTIDYGVPALSKTNISLYDLQGRKLKTLINSIHRPGYYKLSLTLDNLHSGIYIVKIVSGNTSQIRKIALVK